MLGAIVGDIVGSIYEFDNHRSKDFPFFGPGAAFTDDSVLTLAVADALLHGRPPRETLYLWAVRHPKRGYGVGFRNWLTTWELAPYDSWGNGAAMRVSPAALLANTLDEALEAARRVTVVTHNHPEGIKGALATAHAIFLARFGAGPGEIRRTIEDEYGYDLDRSVDSIRPGYTFDESCQRTVPEAIVCALEARDFEDAIRNAISIGGDSDTIAAIAGPIAEARFGIPDEIAHTALARVTDEMRGLLHVLYARSEYAHPVRSLRPAMPGPLLLQRYLALGPIVELEGVRTVRSRLASWPDFLANGRDAAAYFRQQAARGWWDDGIDRQHPGLVALVLEAWPEPKPDAPA